MKCRKRGHVLRPISIPFRLAQIRFYSTTASLPARLRQDRRGLLSRREFITQEQTCEVTDRDYHSSENTDSTLDMRLTNQTAKS